MCGIAGIARLDGSPISPQELDRLTDALAHRGPDGRGTHIAGKVGLGHRRLSIIDLTTAASQPMASADGSVVLTFNGEIYNFSEHRKRLEALGYPFRSHSDTEVLLALYEQEGPACLKHLRGMFAFAVHDQKRNILFLARDRVGKKPLKYFRAGNTFAFASELKALRTLPECPREIDRESLHHFLTMMYVPSPLTGFKGIKKLPAGHALTLDLKTGEETVERYWELSYRPDTHRSIEEWKERIGEKLKESVRLRMIADVPVGAFLSGGIDSAAVVALMAGLTDHPVKTFSIGSDDPAFNELPDAQIVAQAFGTDHHPLPLTADIVHLLPKLVSTYEEPFGDSSAIPTFLLAQQTRKHVTVALNGDGGDENFAGYARYPILRFSEKWHRWPMLFHVFACTGAWLHHLVRDNTFSYRALRFERSMDKPWEQRYLQYLSFFTEKEKHQLYTPGFADAFPRTDEWYADRTAHARALAPDLLHQAMSMDMQTYLPGDLMPKVDLGTMAHGLEARSPLLDHELLELTARLPADLQIRGKIRKWIFKEYLKGVLPMETLTKKKRGFRLPLNKWFRHERKGFVQDRLMGASPVFWEMFDRSAVESFLQQYYGSSIDYSDHVWVLLWLAEWMDQYAPQ